MNKALWTGIALLMLIAILVACGGSAAPEPAAIEPATAVAEEGALVEESAPSQDATPAGESVAEEPASVEEAAPVEEVAAAEETGDMLAGRPTSGIDPATGLEINPPQIIPGVDYLVVGEIMSFNLIPQDSPEFVVLSPAGVRFRIHPQPVDQITYEDGTVPAKMDFKRGMPIMATVRQEEGAGATIVVQSSDFTILQSE